MIKELGIGEISELGDRLKEGFKNFTPEKELSVKELNNAVKDEFTKVKGEVTATNMDNKKLEKIDGYLTTPTERIEMAKKSVGEWSGKPGDSNFTPSKNEALEALRGYGEKDVTYTVGEPDFSKVSEVTVTINDMTSDRVHNFAQADKVAASHFNDIKRDGRTDWTPRDIANWRKENRFSWHERLDRKTMDLVQRDVHEECKHFGGVAECKRLEKLNGGPFDE